MNAQVGPNGRAMMEWLETSGRAPPLVSYCDGGGIWTNGYGSTGPDIVEGLRWTLAQADARFAADLVRFTNYTIPMLEGKPTTPAQFGALVSACYNAGPGSLSNSPILIAHRAGDYAEAAAQWPHWHIRDHAGNIEGGLQKRRAMEAKFYSTGVWQ